MIKVASSSGISGLDGSGGGNDDDSGGGDDDKLHRMIILIMILYIIYHINLICHHIIYLVLSPIEYLSYALFSLSFLKHDTSS